MTEVGFGVPGAGDIDVNRLHDHDDLDITFYSHHHTLGIFPNQASPGDHTHDGIKSKKIDAFPLIKFLLQPPMALLRQQLNPQTIGAAGAAIIFDAEDYDAGLNKLGIAVSGHSLITNPTRYTFPILGWYEIAGAVSWDAVAGTETDRWTLWKKSGVTLAGSTLWLPKASVAADITVTPARTMLVQCTALGQYLELWGGSPPGAQNTYNVQPNESHMYIKWVSD